MLDLLRADEMNVAIETARRQDLALTGDNVGTGADHDRHAGLDVWVARFPNCADVALFNGDIGLYDSPMIDDQRVGDDGVGRTLLVGGLRLAHAVADDLAAAEFHLFAIHREIFLHLDNEVGIRKPHPIAGGRPEHIRIDGAFNPY